MTRVAPLLCVLVLSLAGCGGGGDDANDRLTLTTPKAAKPKATATPSAEKSGKSAGPVTAAEKRVIRSGRTRCAAATSTARSTYWTVPAIAANGDQPVRLLTRAAIRQWNDSLTCGAKLQAVERDAKYVIATFVLTNVRAWTAPAAPASATRPRRCS